MIRGVFRRAVPATKIHLFARLAWNHASGSCLVTLHIPGIFIPASRRAKLGLPMLLNILRIWAYCLGSRSEAAGFYRADRERFLGLP